MYVEDKMNKKEKDAGESKDEVRMKET